MNTFCSDMWQDTRSQYWTVTCHSTYMKQELPTRMVVAANGLGLVLCARLPLFVLQEQEIHHLLLIVPGRGREVRGREVRGGEDGRGREGIVTLLLN